MKVIKPGVIPKEETIVRFTCDRCGCVYEADKGEYQTGYQYNEIWFGCICPCCGKKNYK